MDLKDVDRRKILVVDDDAAINSMVAGYLRSQGFEVICAFDGKEAVEKEELTRPDLVMLDVQMPVMGGFEACRIIRAKRGELNYTPIMFLSGLIDEDLVAAGLKHGADDYVRKPYAPVEVLSRVNNLIKMKDFISQLESLEHIVASMIASIEARDFYTGGHSQRVADISVKLAGEMGLSEEYKRILHKGALLHDIGKIGISDLILNKPGKTTEAEFNSLTKHPEIGNEICSNLRFHPLVIDIIRHHHEKIDGTGYPDGLKGNEIDRLVKIVTVADIYDALTTDRPYRKAKTKEEALSIMEKEAGDGKLDIDIVKHAWKLK